MPESRGSEDLGSGIAFDACCHVTLNFILPPVGLFEFDVKFIFYFTF